MVDHEFRDAVHGFDRFSSDERLVIDSQPFQRLRHIQQLALTSFVYPGATHTRFEHSLGVAEIAGRIFDVVTKSDRVHRDVQSSLPGITDKRSRRAHRFEVRLAALCHDMGHLPFSHAAERELFPEGFSHERMTVEILAGPLNRDVLQHIDIPPSAKRIARIAAGPDLYPHEPFTETELILTDMVTGSVFGADRIDYLLRDSLHAGVAYGRFDVRRLVDSLYVLPGLTGSISDDPVPQLGIKEGGLRAAEALLLARYYMFNQVYFHRVRRALDIHLADYMVEYARAHFDGGRFPTDPISFGNISDADIWSDMIKAAHDPALPGHEAASHIILRKPFKRVWQSTQKQIKDNPDVGRLVFGLLCEHFDPRMIKHDYYPPKRATIDFPVLREDGTVRPASELSQILASIPVASVDDVLVHRTIYRETMDWLVANEERIRNLPMASEEES